ncbi:coiled-coil domain-containing protein 152 [Macrochelys suwanniensis]
MKKISVANLDKLLDDFSQIEKKILEINEENSLLDLQLEKSNRLLILSQSKEDSVKEEYATLQNVIKGLRQTIENQCNLRDENERLKNNTHLLEEKLKAHEQEYKNQIDKLVTEIKNKEEEYKLELTKVHCDLSRKFELKEEEHKEKLEKKEMTILDLTRQLRTLDKEKQNEIIKLQIEVCTTGKRGFHKFKLVRHDLPLVNNVFFCWVSVNIRDFCPFFLFQFNGKLARVQNKTTKSYPDTTVLPQNIYRRKLQHLQEEKNKEIEILRNTIRDLEQRLSSGPDSLLKRRRF